MTSNEIEGMKSFVTSFHLLLSLSSRLSVDSVLVVVIYGVAKKPICLRQRIVISVFLARESICLCEFSSGKPNVLLNLLIRDTLCEN